MTESSPLSYPLTVRVAASTSNLGPGFDFLGLALDLWLEVTVARDRRGTQHELATLSGTAESWPAARDNVLTRALDYAVRESGGTPTPLRIDVRSDIPIARGFGSSGAATVAGLMLGYALSGVTPSIETLVSRGALLEGHPDNTTASLLGGCTLAIPTSRGEPGERGERWRVVRQDVHPTIGFAVAWPARPLDTADGRRALPQSVPLADAIENPRRVAALLEGLRSADPELLALGGEDRLHVRYRMALIPGAARALEAARAQGAWLATVSGSGSGLIALGPRPRCQAIGRAMAAELEAAQGEATSRVVTPSLAAPQVRPA